MGNKLQKNPGWIAKEGGEMQELNKETIQKCKELLVKSKSDILNKISSFRTDIQMQKLAGDEIDQSTTVLQESQMLLENQRLRSRLSEIESALFRIQLGQFGYCEETYEPIEKARLLAIPWTRLSIEGAEMRDSLKVRFA